MPRRSVSTSPRVAVRIRPIGPDDATAVCAFYAGLSADSSRRRFLGWTAPLGLPGSCAFCEVDHGAAEGLVAAIHGGPSDGLLIGHLCLEPDGARGIELALAVTDAYQHQGVGRRLFEVALIWGQDHDIGWLSATALADDAAVIRLLSSIPAGATERSLGSGVVEIRIPISRRGVGIWP